MSGDVIHLLNNNTRFFSSVLWVDEIRKLSTSPGYKSIRVEKKGMKAASICIAYNVCLETSSAKNPLASINSS